MQKSVGNLTIKERIGQMFIVGIDGTEATADLVSLIQEYKVGGVLIRKQNMDTLKQLQTLINELKASNSMNSVPLFIAMEQETGRGNTLPKDIRTLPAIRYIYDNADKQGVYDATYLTANILKQLGVNMNFAPLMDMGGAVNGIPLGDRCISDTNSTAVSTCAVQIINAYKENGIIPTPKYFPGHASTKFERSKLVTPHTKKTIAKLEQTDIVPFKYIIEEGIETMLVGNIQLSKVSMFTPATLTEKVVTKLLKEKYAFEGLAIADDLSKPSIVAQYGLKRAIYSAIEAGNDLMIVNNTSKLKKILEDIENKITKGTLDGKEIENRVQKILDLKGKYELEDKEKADINVDAENEKIEELIKRIRQI